MCIPFRSYWISLRKHDLHLLSLYDTEILWDTDIHFKQNNKANLRDLLVTTGLVKYSYKIKIIDFFSLCDLEIWWMTTKNNIAPVL